MFTVDVEDFNHWRQQARELLKRNVPPDNIAWQYAGQYSLAFSETSNTMLALPVINKELTLPREFFRLAKTVACFRDDSIWALLYSIAWRLLFEDRRLLEFTLDKQVARLLAMRKTIARDMHKMEAFVRFKRIDETTLKERLELAENTHDLPQGTNDLSEYYVAWFEPEHLIVPLKTSFFIKRFNNMRWSILTPDICAHWDTQQLTYTKGINRSPTIEDDLENLWLEYYKNIFNPARLKVKAMQSEMPKKYWANLPEAVLIKDLTRSAQTKTDTMITDNSRPAWEKTAKSSFIQREQKKLREKR